MQHLRGWILQHPCCRYHITILFPQHRTLRSQMHPICPKTRRVKISLTRLKKSMWWKRHNQGTPQENGPSHILHTMCNIICHASSTPSLPPPSLSSSSQSANQYLLPHGQCSNKPGHCGQLGTSQLIQDYTTFPVWNPTLNGRITHPGKDTKTRLTNFMPPPATLLAPRPKFLSLTTSVGVHLFLPLIDGLTAYTFQENIQLVQEDGHTSLYWAKKII
jgi:hypothetical protein